MSRSTRTFSSLSRSILRSRSSLSHQNGPIHVQHVRVVKPRKWITPRKVAIALTVGGIAWLQVPIYEEDEEDRHEAKIRKIEETVQQAKVSTEADKAGAKEIEAGSVSRDDAFQVEEVDEDNIIPEDQPEDAWFIPLSLARQIPQTYYKGTDPEWQGFVEFAKDSKRGQQVRNELAGLAGHHVSSMRNFQNFLGTPTITGKYWLDFDFPDGPPPEYERTGIEITDDYIALTVRPVDPVNVARVQGVLWPKAAGYSFWASFSTFWQLQTAKLRKALNLPESKTSETSGPASGAAEISRMLGQDDSKASKKGSKVRSSDEKLSGTTASVDSSQDLSKSERHWLLRPLPSLTQPSDDMRKATKVFRYTLAKNWKLPLVQPPRGAFLVSGLVEVYGPKGICTLDVRAAYDPKESQWVAIGIDIRRLQKRKQNPKG